MSEKHVEIITENIFIHSYFYSNNNCVIKFDRLLLLFLYLYKSYQYIAVNICKFSNMFLFFELFTFYYFLFCFTSIVKIALLLVYHR